MTQRRVSSMGIQIPSWVTPDRIAALNTLYSACPELGGALNLKSTELWHMWSTSPQVVSQQCGYVPLIVITVRG